MEWSRGVGFGDRDCEIEDRVYSGGMCCGLGQLLVLISYVVRITCFKDKML